MRVLEQVNNAAISPKRVKADGSGGGRMGVEHTSLETWMVVMQVRELLYGILNSKWWTMYLQ